VAYAYFFDSSALVKRYVNEIGTAWVTSLTSPAASNSIYIGRITGVEVVAAIMRAQRQGRVSPTEANTARAKFRQHFDQDYLVIQITESILDRAMELPERYQLRAYDAVQLATALTVNDRRLARAMPALTLISADIDLNAAALAEGLAVDNPNNHP